MVFADSNSQLDLTLPEKKLFQLLLASSDGVGEGEEINTLRVAGGWVRDKLLAKEKVRRKRLWL